MNKKIFAFLTIAFLFTTFSGNAYAAILELPNPLCSAGSNPNCADGAWQAGGYASENDCNRAYGNTCINSFPDLISVITDYALVIIGSLAVIMFIWAGILFVISGGSEHRVSQAKKAALWGVVGVAIALAGKGFIEVVKAIIGNP